MNTLTISIFMASAIGLLLGFVTGQSDLFRLRKIRRPESYDSLINLPHRQLLLDSLRLAIAIARQLKKQNFIGCCVLNLNNFRAVNSTLGRNKGELLLKEVMRCLTETIEEHDTIGRYDGDTFVIVSTTLENEKDIVFLIQKYLDIFSKPFVIGKDEVAITCSIGISCYPHDGQNAEELLKNAEAVMNSAKSRSKGNNFLFFTDKIHTDITKLLELATNLQDALTRDELLLHYQPIVNLQNGHITGVEALLRWQHPKHGIISPQEFIPLAEKSNLINMIGEWVLQTACMQYQEWSNKGLPKIWITVNLSSEQFKLHNLVERIEQIVQKTQMDPTLLEIEISESGFIETNLEMIARLLAITKQGIKLAVDDFGTGYSSFNYLKNFPVNTLKIDQSYIKAIDSTPENAVIVNAMISMAKALQLKIVAEGIETESQFKFLKKNRCDEGQGYYFSRPLDANSMTKLLQEELIQTKNFGHYIE